MATIKIEGVGFNKNSFELQNMSKEDFVASAPHQDLWVGLGQDQRSERLGLAWDKIQEEKKVRPAAAPSKPVAPLTAVAKS